jgi:ATP-dependent RNA helicase MRH4
MAFEENTFEGRNVPRSNMPRPIVRHTITYRQPGTSPPVYLAGSFTEPQWIPQPMDDSLDVDGEYVFTSQVFAVPGHEYQFKFRIGEHDQWVLDDNSPVVTDSMGNQNNLLSVPLVGTPKPTRKAPGKVLNELGIVDIDSRSSTPIEKVASTAAEVADTAEKLDNAQDGDPNASGTNARRAGLVPRLDEPPHTPLFAHECFGAYEFVDDGFDHTELEQDLERVVSSPSRHRKTSVVSAFDDSDVDLNDPTIEKFPSQRGPVLDTLRKIQSSLSEDQVALDNTPPSPGARSSRLSVDSADEGLQSPESLSPTTPTFSMRRENRPSRSSFTMPRSAISLTSIAEEPKGAKAGTMKPGPGLRKPGANVFDRLQTPPTDEEDIIDIGRVRNGN